MTQLAQAHPARKGQCCGSLCSVLCTQAALCWIAKSGMCAELHSARPPAHNRVFRPPATARRSLPERPLVGPGAASRKFSSSGMQIRGILTPAGLCDSDLWLQ